MSNLTSVLAQAKALSEQEQQELLTQLEEYLVLGSQVTQVTKEVKEMRFSKGRVCCYCNGTDVVRNGKRNGVQRYLCSNCQRSFSDLTNSATYRSKKTLDKWLRYAKCMLNGFSIRKSAEEVEINIVTSFYWRHKILNCISEFLGVGSVDGVVEADEVFFAYSYKGTKPANMPRTSRKRGKQVKKRGISILFQYQILSFHILFVFYTSVQILCDIYNSIYYVLNYLCRCSLTTPPLKNILVGKPKIFFQRRHFFIHS